MAPRIPISEWNRHREEILKLYLNKDLSTKQVAKHMAPRFSFSGAQLEIQLKSWGARKNLKSHEWDVILAEIERLPRAVQTRIKIGDYELSKRHIIRGKRYRKSAKVASNLGNNIDAHNLDTLRDSGVVIETCRDGEWLPHISSDVEASIEENQGFSGLLETNQFGLLTAVESMESAPEFDLAIDDPFLSDTLPLGSTESVPEFDLAIDNPSMPATLQLVQPTPTMPEHQIWRDHISSRPVSPSNVSISSISITSQYETGETFWASIATVYQRALYMLPVARFERDMQLQNTIRATVAMTYGNSTSLVRAEDQLAEFLACIQGDKNCDVHVQRSLMINRLLKTIDTIVPKTFSEPSADSQQGLITSDEVFETKLWRFLIWSFVNGFAGLGDFPPGKLLTYIAQRKALCSLFFLLLDNAPSYLAKACAETLFRGAIQNKFVVIVRELTKRKLVNVNCVFTTGYSGNISPLVEAAALQCIDIVRILLDAGADPNVSGDAILQLHLSFSYGGLLLPKKSMITFSTKLKDIFSLLIDRGFRITPGLLRASLRYSDTSLCELLLSRVSPSDHALFIRSEILGVILQCLSDDVALQATQRLFIDCEETDCHECVKEFSSSLENALVTALMRSHLRLAKYLIQRYPATSPRVLCASISSGKRELFNHLLENGAIVSHEIISIYPNQSRLGYLHQKEDTTMLAEALLVQDLTIISILEEKGALQSLKYKTCFRLALEAASKVGTVEYIRKILDLQDLEDVYSERSPGQSSAVLNAVEAKNTEIVTMLLSKGHPVRIGDINAAIRAEDIVTMENMLNAKVVTRLYEKAILVANIISWGKRNILKDLFTALQLNLRGYLFNDNDDKYGDHDYYHDDDDDDDYDRDHYSLDKQIIEIVKNKDKRTIWELSDLHPGFQGLFLRAAIGEGELELTRELLNRGAYVLDHHVTHSMYYPTIHRLVLQHQLCQRPLFKRWEVAIKRASCSSAALQSFKMLLSTKRFHSNDQRNALFAAVKHIGTEYGLHIVEELFNAGCDPNQLEADYYSGHRTAFLAAIETRSKELVQLFISRGANVNWRAKLGVRRTPLQKAAEIGSLEIVQLLIKAGAHPNGEPSFYGGGTALQFAAIVGNCKIAAELLDHGARIDASPSTVQGRWLLEAAAEYGRIDMVSYLWTVGHGPKTFSTEQCQSAMKLARKNRHYGCAELIESLSTSPEMLSDV